MKIAKSLRDAYAVAFEKYERLGIDVKGTLKTRVEEKGWFFSGRLKTLESYALKVETGRVGNLAAMEDFFGCTIVVPSATALPEAERFVAEYFTLRERRPPADDQTRKPPYSFMFDDVRLYLHRGPDPTGQNPDLDDLPFEVQLKTVLQYAWGIATHDLIYKSDSVSWSKQRIAFQVKAMLEHAEVAIAEATGLSASPSVAKVDDRTASTISVLTQVSAYWPTDQLPEDVKRLSESVLELLQCCDRKPADLTAILDKEVARLGTLPNDLSPYSFALQALVNDPDSDFQTRFNRRNVRTKVVVHSGMEVPTWMTKPNNRVIRLPG